MTRGAFCQSVFTAILTLYDMPLNDICQPWQQVFMTVTVGSRQENFAASAFSDSALFARGKVIGSMGLHEKLLAWYLRISRIFGVFPISRSPHGPVTFSLYSLSTLYSVVMCLCYTVSMSDFIYNRLQQNLQLSYHLTVLPNTVVSAATGFLICISSMRSRNDLVKLMVITDQSKFHHRGQWGMGYLGKVPALHFICCLIQFIRHGLLFPERRPSGTFLATGWEWDRLLSFASSLLDFFSDGVSSSAICFLIFFGKRVVLSFQLLCREIAEGCRATMVHTYQGIVHIGSKVEAPTLIVPSPLCGPELAQKFLQQKLAFEIYSKIGGAFIFALVTDIGTWLFYLVCAVLFNTENSSSWFPFTIKIFQAIVFVLVLLTVAELGHQITTQVLIELLLK